MEGIIDGLPKTLSKGSSVISGSEAGAKASLGAGGFLSLHDKVSLYKVMKA